MIIIRNCKFSENPRRIPLHVHLQCPGQCRIVHRPCRSRGDECCRSRQLFVGKYPAERSSILPSGASGKFHANRHIELTGPDQTAEGFGPGGRAWGTGLEDGSAEWVCGMEPSTISGFSVDGSALDAEPSMMRGVFVEGSGPRNGTFHDFGPQRGWFRPTACSAQQLRANTRERGYCRRWLWTGFADRAPGPGYAPMLAAKRRARLCTSSLAYGRKTEEAANRHYSGLQPQ